MKPQGTIFEFCQKAYIHHRLCVWFGLLQPVIATKNSWNNSVLYAINYLKVFRESLRTLIFQCRLQCNSICSSRRYIGIPIVTDYNQFLYVRLQSEIFHSLPSKLLLSCWINVFNLRSSTTVKWFYHVWTCIKLS